MTKQRNMKTSSLAVANEILRQLGGSKFIAMTGSKNFAGGEDVLTMHLAKNISKAKYLRIELNMNDTYTMIFFSTQGKKDYTFPIVAKYDNVYNDMLQSIFTDVTGLYTSF